MRELSEDEAAIVALVREFVDRYVKPAAPLRVRANPWSSGDGLEFALARGASLSDGLGQNRRVHQREIAFVEEIPDRLLDFVPNARNCALAWRPQPEMSVVEKEVDAVLFGLDRIVRDRCVGGSG